MSNRTIQIDPVVLGEITTEFETSKNMLMSLSFSAPAKTGSGSSVDELSAMENDYVAIRDAVVLLLDKTKEFMRQSAADAIVLDNSIANKMNFGE